jgi:hypothetical protein
MALIGMGEAAKRLHITTNSARRALQNAHVPLTMISNRCYTVDESDLETFMLLGGANRSKGRPRKGAMLQSISAERQGKSERKSEQ